MGSVLRRILIGHFAIYFASSVNAVQRIFDDDESTCQKRGKNFGSDGSTFNNYQHYALIASYIEGEDIDKDAAHLRNMQNDVNMTRLDLQLYNANSEDYPEDPDEATAEHRELYGNLILIA